MENKKPLILISNDDGISSKGIKELVKFVRHLGEIVVVAPDQHRSGNSSALTVVSPVHYKKVKEEEGVTWYSCSGTPVDCIKLAKGEILSQVPDLILGGINNGDNSAVNVHYSGTMGIAIEGCLGGIPSIGYSLCNHDADADFSSLKAIISKVTEEVLQTGLPDLTCLNVNFPMGEIKGVKVCTQSRGSWTQEWERCPRSFDPNYFWLGGSFKPEQPISEKSDYWALQNGYASITPTKVDVTAYQELEQLTERFECLTK